MITQINRKAGIQFTPISAPQPQDIIAAQASDIVETVKSGIHPKALEYFHGTADLILDGNNKKFKKNIILILFSV